MDPVHEHVVVLIDVVRDFGYGDRHIRVSRWFRSLTGISRSGGFRQRAEEVDRLMNAAILGSSAQG